MILTKIPAKRKNDFFLAITDAYREDGKVKRRTVLSLGYLSKLKKEYEDPIAHFEEIARKMTEEKKLRGGIQNIKIDFSFEADNDSTFKTGNLLINQILNAFKFDYLFRKVRENTKSKIDFKKIFYFLVSNQILKPSSKLNAFENQSKMYGVKNIELHDIYRSLSVFNLLSQDIQKQMFKYSENLTKREINTLYYDATNFYFEIDIEDEFRKFGYSKEHRPNPLVQMGLLSDSDGIPISYELFKGNQNEQLSLIPIEEKIITGVKDRRLIICADAGLCSSNNKYFNSISNREYIFVQSLRKVKKYISNEIFDEKEGKWVHVNEKFKYFVRPINDEITLSLIENNSFKTRHEANLIITYDEDFANYLKSVREKRIEKAKQIIENPSKYNKETSKDGRQYIKDIHYTSEGEIINKTLVLDIEKIKNEEKYDGYYALITSLINERPEKVIAINKNRWEIEDCFRILKTNLKSRPVYLSEEDHIKGHFLITYVALVVIKLLQKLLRTKALLLKEETTTEKIIDSLRKLQVIKLNNEVYVNGDVDNLAKTLSSMFDLGLNRKFLRESFLLTKE